MTISLAHILPLSEVNGPGARSVIWVQGCPKRCPECWNPEFLSFDSAWTLTPQELFGHLREITADFAAIEGITLSGGEPFAQAGPLVEFVTECRASGLSIMSYSGFTLEEIEAKGGPCEDLLNQLDILVDGEYMANLQCDRLWRGSLNQRVHLLTDRYENHRDRLDREEREFEVTIGKNGLTITGFPEPPILSAVSGKNANNSEPAGS